MNGLKQDDLLFLVKKEIDFSLVDIEEVIFDIIND